MDDWLVDRLAKALRTRRSLLGLVAGVGGVLAAGRHEAVAKKCKKTCGPCKRCKKGKCRQKKPDGTLCGNGGQCLGGNCCTPRCDDRPCNSPDDCGGNCACPPGQACLSEGTCGTCPENADCANIPCGETSAGAPCRCVVSVDDQVLCVAIAGDGILIKFNVACTDEQCTDEVGKPSICADFMGCPPGNVSRFWCLPSCTAV